MKIGTKTPLSIDQAVTGDGSKSVMTIDKVKVIKISGTPVMFALEMKFPIRAAQTVPISVALKIEIKVEAKKMRTSVLPMPSRE